MKIDWDYFIRMQGSVYRVESDGQSVALALESAERLPPSQREGGAFRLEFRGPLEPALPQATHRFSASGDEFDMFIVPVRRDSAGMLYEAVFN